LRFILQIALWASRMASISRLDFSNLLFLTFIGSRSATKLILSILVIHFIRTYCKKPYKISKFVPQLKSCEMTSFRTPTRFSYFLNKKLISVPILPKVPILPNCYIAPQVIILILILKVKFTFLILFKNSNRNYLRDK
jgi:hypothetical protein